MSRFRCLRKAENICHVYTERSFLILYLILVVF